jgi:topoisomerase-4 subunit A
MVCAAWWDAPQLEVTFGGAHSSRPADIIDVEEFIGVKSHRAKGKRITTYDVSSLSFLPAPEPDVAEVSELVEVTGEEEPRATEPAETGFDKLSHRPEARVTEPVEVTREPEAMGKSEATDGIASTSSATGEGEARVAEPVEVGFDKLSHRPEARVTEPVEVTGKPEATGKSEATDSIASTNSVTGEEDFDLVIERAEEKESSRNPDIQQLDLF